MKNSLRNTIGVLYSILIGLFIGFITWLFLYLVYIGIHLFWDSFILETNSKLLILSVCIFGGVLVGICEKYIGKYPKTMEIVLKEYKTTKSVEYKSLPKSIIKVFTVLWFGGTVGPEAALTGIIGGISTLVGKFLKYGFSRTQSKVIKTNSAMQKLFEIPLYGFYNFLDPNDKKRVKNYKRLLYGTIILFSLSMLLLLGHLDNKVSFITRFSKVTLGSREFIFLIPLFIIGLLIVFYSRVLDKFIAKIFKPLQKYKILTAIIGGAILGLLAITLPFMLFSGEHTLRQLIAKSYILGPTILLLIGLCKLLLSKICINTGWIGGPIFPIMFSSAAIGMAFSFIFAINLPFAVAIVMSTSLAGIMENYKIAVILLICFFTFNIWILILITAFISEFIFKKIKTIHVHTLKKI